MEIKLCFKNRTGMQLKSFNHTAQSCHTFTVFNKNLLRSHPFKNYYFCAEDSLIP